MTDQLRYKLTVAYDGTDFAGWQKQEPPDRDAPIDPETGEHPRTKLRTVQEVLEQAVRETVREPVNIKGASRTDSGVHALAQCATFACSASAPQGRGWPEDRGTDPLRRTINGRLPDDVLVTDAQLVPMAFDPIADCESKGYSYTLHCSRERPLWNRRYVHQVWEDLDAAAMHEAAQHFTGEHDFAAFAAAGHGRQSTVRTIYACNVERSGDTVTIHVSGNGFLYNMVRILAGTLYEVGRGRTKPGDIPAIIQSTDRRNAGVTLPPTGLRLDWINYRDPD